MRKELSLWQMASERFGTPTFVVIEDTDGKEESLHAGADLYDAIKAHVARFDEIKEKAPDKVSEETDKTVNRLRSIDHNTAGMLQAMASNGTVQLVGISIAATNLGVTVGVLLREVLLGEDKPAETGPDQDVPVAETVQLWGGRTQHESGSSSPVVYDVKISGYAEIIAEETTFFPIVFVRLNRAWMGKWGMTLQFKTVGPLGLGLFYSNRLVCEKEDISGKYTDRVYSGEFVFPSDCKEIKMTLHGFLDTSRNTEIEVGMISET